MEMDGETVAEQDAQNEITTVGDDTDDDFQAGLNGTATETPQVPEQTEEVTAKGDDGTPASNDQPDATAQPDADQAPEPEFVQLTKQDYDKLMKRADEVDNLKTQNQQQIDKVFGSIGGIQRTLNELRTQPAGKPLQLSEDAFAELKAEYPELADLTVKGMQRVLENVRAGGQGINPEAMEQAISESASTTRTELIDSHLDAIVDGDWREEVQTPKYAEWIATQDEATRALENSSNLRDAARLMRKFKAFRDAPPPSTPDPSKSASPAARMRAAAVPPRSAGPAPVKPSEDDDFQAGLSYLKTG